MKLIKKIKESLSKLKFNYVYAIVGILIAISCLSTVALAQSNQVVVKANVLNVRVGPGLSYGTITQVKHGDKLNILSKKNQWYQVRLSGDKIGWVASWLIDNNDANTSSNAIGVVKAPNTNVQKYPDKNSDVLGTLTQSQKVNIIYSQNNWTQILYNKTVGWIPNSEIIATDKTASDIKNSGKTGNDNSIDIKSVTTLQNNTKILSQPSDNASTVAHITDKTTLQYVGKSGNFYKVRLNSGQTGYVNSGLVSISDTDHPIKSAATKLSEATIVIDAGHGGHDTGAISNDNKHFEKTYTLATALLLKQKLQRAGANVILTRGSDSYVGLEPRARLSNKLAADAFVSIHFDSSSSKNKGSGITTYYYSGSKDKRLAQNVNNNMNGLPLKSKGIDYGDFEVTRENEQPAILVEGGYINNKNDFKQISDPIYQNRLADGIYRGLASYFK